MGRPFLLMHLSSEMQFLDRYRQAFVDEGYCEVLKVILQSDMGLS